MLRIFVQDVLGKVLIQLRNDTQISVNLHLCRVFPELAFNYQLQQFSTILTTLGQLTLQFSSVCTERSG